jgi:hypothetical protein
MVWRYGVRHCAQCPAELPADARADAVYCSDACRKAANRSRRVNLASEVIEWLSDTHWADQQAAAAIPGRHPALAASASTEAAEGMIELLNGDGPMWRKKAEQIRCRRPDLWVEFTGSAILAAARPVGIGACRWCDALSRAAMADEVITRDSGTIKLLGGMCDRCRPLVASVASLSTTATATATTRAGLAVSPALATNHRSCTTCKIAELAEAEAKRTRNAPELAHLTARAKQPHQPLPGMMPTGLYKRDGQWRLRYSTRTAR